MRSASKPYVPSEGEHRALAPRTRLRGERFRQQLSQAEVAEQVGTTDLNISRWERGITRPGPYFRKKLCNFLGRTRGNWIWPYNRVLPSPTSSTRASRLTRPGHLSGARTKSQPFRPASGPARSTLRLRSPVLIHRHPRPHTERVGKLP
jgi:transcriptional regulator with XRE-family HTH domain